MPQTIVNGISMHYQSHGDGPPLLLIHGLGSSLRDWEYQVDHFTPRFRVFTVDLRGHGRSDKPKGPYAMSLFAKDVAAFLKKIAGEPAHVVGLSMGGAVAFHLALDHAHLVKSIVIANMSGMVPVDTFTRKHLYYSRLVLSALMGPGAVGKFIAKHVFPAPEMAPLRHTMEARWAENPRRPYLASLRALKNWSVMDRLHRIACPALLIHSEHDYAPLDHKKEVAARMQNATLMTLPGTHHVVNVEEPASFNALVMNFLKNLEERPAE
ncbi:alpha/beta fold hydrolase [Desulfoluna butyratoxydans]|uniref:Alpha/beta hydrolase fold n=1 Tax=Desulfoluna butyratoxydans TaxID=231438 RepID=A0A4U8YJT0_9BACT|nr:alpha/beta hydrolase [Desulfoluna butyratoxydans]VFQ43329.1 alpha/beta hydrolase fold [Desulfoluna butyratoxydans]